MVAEDRIARLESDVSELKGDVKTLNARIGESIIANAREFGDLRTVMEKGFGALRTEMERNRADAEKRFGTLQVEIERNRADAEKRFATLQAEAEKRFGGLRAEAEKNRTDTEKGFGALKASIESAKLWMLVTGVGSVILVTFVTFLGRALKLY